MLIKNALLVTLAAIVLYAFLVPGAISRLLGRLGRSVGGFSRAGKELLSGEEVRGSPLGRYEILAGRALEEKVLRAHPPSVDPALAERVKRVGDRLRQASERREVSYRFLALEGSIPTAFSIPGGAVFATRPLIEVTGWDDHQLAGLLAHEMAHIEARHAVQHLATTAIARSGLRLLLGGKSGILGKAIGSLEGLLEGGYPRHQELEADRLALKLVANAGHDPRAYPFFLRRILELGLDRCPYFQGHPPIQERLRAMGMG